MANKAGQAQTHRHTKAAVTRCKRNKCLSCGWADVRACVHANEEEEEEEEEEEKNKKGSAVAGEKHLVLLLTKGGAIVLKVERG